IRIGAETVFSDLSTRASIHGSYTVSARTTKRDCPLSNNEIVTTRVYASASTPPPVKALGVRLLTHIKCDGNTRALASVGKHHMRDITGKQNHHSRFRL